MVLLVLSLLEVLESAARAGIEQRYAPRLFIYSFDHELFWYFALPYMFSAVVALITDH